MVAASNELGAEQWRLPKLKNRSGTLRGKRENTTNPHHQQFAAIAVSH